MVSWKRHFFIEEGKALFHGHGFIEKGIVSKKNNVSWGGHCFIEKVLFCRNPC